jgi:hypothetical protein
MAGLLEFAVRFGTEERCIEHLAGLRWPGGAGRVGLAGWGWPGGFVCARGGGQQAWRLKARAAGLRMRRLPPAGSGDGRDGVSSHPHRSREVVSRRLPDGPRQARRLGQISAARTGGGLPDRLDHGAQAAPRAERGPGPSAAGLSRSRRDLHRRPRRSDQSRPQHQEPRQEPGRGRRRDGAGAKEQAGKARACRHASARLHCRQRPHRRAADRHRRQTGRLSEGQCRRPIASADRPVCRLSRPR